MRFALILCLFAISKPLLIVLGLPNENDFGEPLFIKETRNFGGILGGGTGTGGGRFPGIGGGSNIRFYKLNVATSPRTTEPPASETCDVKKFNCCKFMCTNACNSKGKDESDICLDTSGAVTGTPCLDSDNCKACGTVEDSAALVPCTTKTTKCEPESATVKICTIMK